MNFKFFLLLFILCGCGVKSAPLAPKDSSYPSYDSKFLTKPDPTPTPKPNNE